MFEKTLDAIDLKEYLFGFFKNSPVIWIYIYIYLFTLAIIFTLVVIAYQKR